MTIVDDGIITPLGYKPTTEQIALENSAIMLYNMGWCPMDEIKCQFSCTGQDEKFDAVSCIVEYFLKQERS